MRVDWVNEVKKYCMAGKISASFSACTCTGMWVKGGRNEMKAYYVTACVCTLIGCIIEKYRQVTGFHFNKFSIASLAGFTQSWWPPKGIWKPLRSSCSGVIKLLRPVMSWLAPAMHQELDFQGCKLRCRWPINNYPYRFQLSMSFCFVRCFFFTITLQSHHFITPMSLRPSVVQWISCWTRALLQHKHTRPVSSRLAVPSFQVFCLRTLEQERPARFTCTNTAGGARVQKKKKEKKTKEKKRFIDVFHSGGTLTPTNNTVHTNTSMMHSRPPR